MISGVEMIVNIREILESFILFNFLKLINPLSSIISQFPGKIGNISSTDNLDLYILLAICSFLSLPGRLLCIYCKCQRCD